MERFNECLSKEDAVELVGKMLLPLKNKYKNNYGQLIKYVTLHLGTLIFQL